MDRAGAGVARCLGTLPRHAGVSGWKGLRQSGNAGNAEQGPRADKWGTLFGRELCLRRAAAAAPPSSRMRILSARRGEEDAVRRGPPGGGCGMARRGAGTPLGTPPDKASGNEAQRTAHFYGGRAPRPGHRKLHCLEQHPIPAEADRHAPPRHDGGEGANVASNAVLAPGKRKTAVLHRLPDPRPSGRSPGRPSGRPGPSPRASSWPRSRRPAPGGGRRRNSVKSVGRDDEEALCKPKIMSRSTSSAPCARWRD